MGGREARWRRGRMGGREARRRKVGRSLVVGRGWIQLKTDSLARLAKRLFNQALGLLG